MTIEMRLMAAVIIFSLCASCATAAVEGFPVSNIMFETDACSSALRYSCFLPGAVTLCPILALCFPILCPFALCFYPIYRIPDYLFPLGWIIMLVMTSLIPCSGLVARVAAFVPGACFVISSVLNTLLAYPLTQMVCALCPFTLPPVLLCSPVHQTIFSAIACLTPLYYQTLFPVLTSLRMGISERIGCLKSPLCSALAFNIEHIPSYTAYPDLYCLLCGAPFRCLQAATTPLFCLSSVCCLPLVPSIIMEILMILPTTCLMIRKFLCNDLARLITPQNTCLPTYQGLFP